MQKAKAIELDIAVVDGVELNGSWNRMFEPRVISEYDLSVLDSITQIPGAESLGYCYQCGKCTGVCPVDTVGDYSCRETSYCCGGGGGGMWMDSFTRDYASERLSERRVKEAIEYGAEILAVSCPYEVPRFEDAVKSTGHDGELQVMDIAELMAYCMGLNEALVLH
ncbi:heterodisulfide reductase-related iron-sulfur binding cluster [Sulfobacillus thermotolerans]|uniref:heterodisulfide reductase-related iron-sulfur binding cluster n=1 Tax=Sulfobacillus thermotolerans TaxID=338644 RepID=UPI0033692C12